MTSIVVGKDRINLLESERYVAGTKNVYLMKVAFSEDWESLEKKIVFKTDCFQQTVELISCSEQFPIPSEVFARPTNKLQIGAYGYACDKLALNTRWLSLGRIQKGTLDTNCCCGPSHPMKPSPDTYAALKEMIERKADRLTFENGQFMLWAGDDLLSSFDPPVMLPDGGDIDQVLAKASNADGDYKWMTIPNAPSIAASFKVPLGTIQIWSGAIDNIPESYSLCDGQNGTPDLRSAMIVGASEYIEPGTVVYGPDANQPMPANYLEPDGPDPTTIRYYALAFVQKTSLTEADKKEGQTAYDLAVEQGYEGTLDEWLESLHGKSAYDLAVEQGYTGTIEEFTQNLTTNAETVVKDLRITSKQELPDEGFGAFYFENVWFQQKTRGNALQLNKMIAYIDTQDPTKIIVTTLNNHRYEMLLDTDGYIISISESESFSPENGKSAYELAQQQGFEGTLEEWLESLKGSDGADGESAYELAVEGGFEGTLNEWLASLKGVDGSSGESAYDLAVKQGFEGTLDEWLASLKGEKGDKGDTVTGDGTVVEGTPGKDGKDGKDGQSAYQIAVANGFSGTEEEWLASLKGSTGLSAYQVAKANGFEGTETEWVESLKGANGSDGLSAYDLAVKEGYTGTEAEWLASLKGADGQNGSDGADGKDGANGVDGKSAYQLAVDNGYTGTETEWLASLKGEPGADGKDGTNGINGVDGKSAYEIAVDNGFEGTEADWLASLKGSDGLSGENGKSAYQLAVDAGYTGSEADWLASLKGENGKSAYQLAVDEGFEGTLEDWLASLGSGSSESGADGKSAYDIAVDNGFEGTEAEWLASLKGEKGDTGIGIPGEDGKSAYDIAVDNGFEGTEAEWLESLKGATGGRGKSAYQLAVDNGFDGDEAAWLASLKGPKGDAGKNGADGKSAYELAVEQGFEGTEEDWIAAAQNGKSAYELAVEQGYEGTLQQWLDSLKGEGIEEFLTFSNQTITTADVFDSVESSRAVHFQNCTIAAADGNSVHFDDELADVTRYLMSFEIYQLNNETIKLTFGEDDIFDTLEIKAIDEGLEVPSASFLTYSNAEITQKTELSDITEPMSVHFKNCTVSAADENAVHFDDELTFVTPGDNHYLVHRTNGEIVHIACSEDGTFNSILVDVIEDGRNGADGKSAYEVAVEQGFEGSKDEWLASLKGKAGKDGKDAIALQKLDDYMAYEAGAVVVGRWVDGKKIYRRLLRINRAYTTMTITAGNAAHLKYELQGYMQRMEHVIKIEGFVQFCLTSDPTILYQLPLPYSNMHPEDSNKLAIAVNAMYVMSTEDDIPNYISVGIRNLSDTNRVLGNVKSHIIVDYVPENSDVMEDSDLIIPDYVNVSGTSDHTQLINRDATQQHPMSAISGLTDRLAATPSQVISTEQIDALFNT